ncbi:MAG: single-stranded-DNA-specific exonuclease RecJ [Spirochaetota bacterium]
MKSNWLTKTIDEETINEFSSVLGIDRSLASILLVRGITNIKEAHRFLNPRLSGLHSPYLMKGMYDAVMRIRKAISGNEKIGIFADSDLDGLTSLTVLTNLLENFGNKPHYRFAVDDEEYGLRKEVIDEMIDNKITLLITLDCGIRDIEEIGYAKELGIDVIVCDHHEQKNELPSAIIINPKLWDSEYPFKELAGVGVTFKFCHAILMSYLQSFNKLFIIIIKDENSICLSFIKNGIVERIEKIKEVSELKPENIGSADECNIIIFDTEDNAELKRIFKDYKIFYFNNLLNVMPGKKVLPNAGLDELCKTFSINRKIFNNKCDIINIIFSEIEYNNSEKVINFLNSIIDLVSVGTVADIMPLSGENRIIIHHGLKSLNSTSHPGLSILVKKLSSKMTAKKIAWDISPLLNTPGRFGKTHLIAKFFLEKDKEKLTQVISEINKLNEKRKALIAELFNIFYSEISEGKHISAEKLVFITSEKIPEGLCGLLANRIADITNKPVIIISLYGNKEMVKGSGRAVGNFNFFSIVETHSDLFEKIGGHKQAFGFTVSKDNIEKLRKKVVESIENRFIKKTDYNIDLNIPIESINYNFINSLDLFEPYGYRNEECLFLTRNVELSDFRRFGQNMNHGKFFFKKNKYVEAIGWDMADTMEEYMRNKKVDIIYKLENSTYNGRIFPRMLVVDLS